MFTKNRILVVARIVLVLVLVTCIFGVVPVLASSEKPNEGIPLVDFLSTNGTLKLDGKVSGSLDLQGWDVQISDERGPIFSPKASKQLPPLVTTTLGEWSALGNNGAGNGALNGQVFAIAVSGTDVYVGGNFTNAGGNQKADYIAKWDGATWSNLGDNGVLPSENANGALVGPVFAIAVSGDDVYIGTGGSAFWFLPEGKYIAKWDGTNWSALGGDGVGGSSINGNVVAIAIDGNDVYVGGNFTNVKNGSTTLPEADYLAKWDGANWSAVGNNGAGNGSLNNMVHTLAVKGTDLYVGGNFTDVKNGTTTLTEADYIAKWDGIGWSALGNNGGSPLNGSISGAGVGVYDIDFIGDDVYVAGMFVDVNNYGTILNAADYIAKWDGTNWSALGDDGSGDGAISNPSGVTLVGRIAVGGNNVYVGGYFQNVNDGGNVLTAADYVAKWDGTNWSALGSDGGTPPNGSLNTLGEGTVAVGNDNLYVGGFFTNVNNNGVVLNTADYIAAYGLGPTIIYVNDDATGANNGSSWIDAYTDLQSALAVGQSGDQIWVAAGTYKPTAGADRTASFVLKNGVELYGNFTTTFTSLEERANCICPVTLSGDIGIEGDDSDNSYHVVVSSNTDDSTLLDSFIITAGNANGSSTDSYGGGIYNHLGSPTLRDVNFDENSAFLGGGMYSYGDQYTSYAPTLMDVVFQNNTAEEGGGMFNDNYVQATLTDVTFKNNTATRAGGGMEDRLGSPSLTDVVFNNNSAGLSAGGMQNFSLNASLTNVTFSNNSATSFGGGMVNATFDDTTMTNVTLYGNSAEFGGGMWNSNSSPMLKNVTISGNTAVTHGGGIFNAGNGTPILTNVTISGNTAGSSGGGFYNDGNNATIHNSILYGNTGGEVLGTANVTYTILEGGYAGAGNLDVDPLLGPLQDNGGSLLTMALGAGSPAIDLADDSICPDTDQRGIPRPQDDHCDMGAYEYRHEVLHVKWNATGSNDGTSWVNAYADLQAALSASLYGDEIWVAAGTYYPTPGTDRTISFNLQNGVMMYGGFSGTETLLAQRDFETNITILSGDIGVLGDNSDNSYHVVFAGKYSDSGSYQGGTTVINDATVLDGFTITAGNANGELEHRDGGGMLNLQSHPVIANVIFTGNSSSSHGGGMHNAQSHSTLSNVAFNNNSTNNGGGLSIVQSTLALTNVTVSGNSAGSQGGGISITQSDPILTNVTISGNSASSGGGIYNTTSDPTLTNVTVSGNSASSGGGMYNTTSDPTLTNVTISGNSATTQGGGIYNRLNNATIRNTILWGNTAPTGSQIYNFMFNTSPAVSYSVVQGGYTGINNINANPLLGPLQDNGGFTQTMALQNGSPAIDNGDISNCPATDQRGVIRPQGSQCDIGAYEFGELILPTSTPTLAHTPTFTMTNTATPTVTLTPTPTFTKTNTATLTATLTPANTLTHTPTFTLTNTATHTPVLINTHTPTFTSTSIASPVPVSAVFSSQGNFDGWILESSETSNSGGSMNSNSDTFYLGDDSQNRQYRAILHFDTSSLPDNAVIVDAKLRLSTNEVVTGTNPFLTHDKIVIELNTGPYSSNNTLQLGDFKVPSDRNGAGAVQDNLVNGFYRGRIKGAGLEYFNLSGVTQLRLRFKTDDDNDNMADLIEFYSGNASVGADRPRLVIYYYIP